MKTCTITGDAVSPRDDRQPSRVFSSFPSMKRNLNKNLLFSGLLFFVSTFAIKVAAQSPSAKDKVAADGTDNLWWYTAALVVTAALIIAFYLWQKSKKGNDNSQIDDNRYRDYYSTESYDMEGVDAEKEMEWLRKVKKSKPKTPKFNYRLKDADAAKKQVSAAPGAANSLESSLDTKKFQEKMRKLQYDQLPINSFNGISPAKTYYPLPVSDDPSLMSAIEQANEEFEEDESVRELVVRILAAFKTANSVEALSQIALYDLSSNLRSKAVSVLTDFDHETVFETILLACADPTREVRAAAARGMFGLSLDRADAWTRILEDGDEFRMIHATRAAVEAGFVVNAFERLIHDDLKLSYEAFALIALVIKSSETQPIFDAIRDHKDERVKFALLHVLKAVKDERSVTELAKIKNSHVFPADVSGRILDTIKSFEHVSA